MATATADKIREKRLRNAAKRQGYDITKSRTRDPRALDYGGYMIMDPYENTVEAGSGFSMTLSDVEKWLTSDEADIRERA